MLSSAFVVLTFCFTLSCGNKMFAVDSDSVVGCAFSRSALTTGHGFHSPLSPFHPGLSYHIPWGQNFGSVDGSV